MIKAYIYAFQNQNGNIFHHGIKGQRWGVRRFQNKDGTLTPLGEERYGDDKGQLVKDYNAADQTAAKAILEGTSKSLNDASNLVGNIGKNKSKTINNADYRRLSDTELRNRINRLSMERSYGDLTGDTKRVRSGSDWTREILQTVGAVAGIGATVASTMLIINQIKLGKLEGKKKGG